MPRNYRLLVLTALVAAIGLTACHTTRHHGCGCGMEEHLRVR